MTVTNAQTNAVRGRKAATAAAVPNPAPAVPLGLLVIGRKRPGFDQEWNAIIRRRAAACMESLGFECIGAETPVIDDQTIADAIDAIRERGCTALVVLQPSIGNGQLAMSVIQRWSDPIVLWATPERAESERVSSCSLVGQHMLASILRGAGHPFELVYGDPDDEPLRRDLLRAVVLARTTAALRHALIGMIGAQPPGYLAMAPDVLATRRQIGVQLAPLSLVQFTDRVRDVDADAVRKDVELVRAARLPMTDVTDADLEMQSRYYLAMRALMAEEGLDGLSVQEWPEMPNVLDHWPYLAMSRLAGEGIPVSMEGDVDGAITCLIGAGLGAGAGFITDWLEHDDDTIGFWHPGTAPLSMLSVPTLAKHFNIVRPMSVDGVLRASGPVTIARLWRCDGRYQLTAFEGVAIEPQRKLTGNSAWVRVEGGGVPEWFDSLCHAGVPHHVVLFEGSHVESFRRLARMLRVKWHGRLTHACS